MSAGVCPVYQITGLGDFSSKPSERVYSTSEIGHMLSPGPKTQGNSTNKRSRHPCLPPRCNSTFIMPHTYGHSYLMDEEKFEVGF